MTRMNKKLIVGLTGGISSGKSTAYSALKNIGVNIIDADIISNEIVEDNLFIKKKIIDFFGEALIKKENIPDSKIYCYPIDKFFLRTKIFSSYKNLHFIENLLHPIIINKIINEIKNHSSGVLVIIIPLLFEKNLRYLFDRVLLIDTFKKNQINRSINRGFKKNILNKILDIQFSRRKKRNLSDDIVTNNGTIENFKKKIIHIYNHKYENMLL